MKRFVFAFLIFGLLLACSGNDTRYRNPFLPNYNFSMSVNLNLPLYSNLASPIFPMKLTDPSTGTEIIAMKISDTDYRAWDSSCPNQYPAACSRMEINGVNAKCSCEDYEYSIFNGVGDGEYTMRPYRVEVIDPKLIRIYN